MSNPGGGGLAGDPGGGDDDVIGQVNGPYGPPGAGGNGPPGGNGDEVGGAGGGAGAADAVSEADDQPMLDDQGRPIDSEGFLLVADPAGTDVDGQVAGKSHVVQLARQIKIVPALPINPYGMMTDTARFIRFYTENGAMIGMRGTLEDFEEENLFLTEELLRMGFDVGDAECKFGATALDDNVDEMGLYEKQIADKRLQLRKVISALKEAQACAQQKKLTNQLEAEKKRGETREEELKKRAANAEKRATAMRPCLVCHKALPGAYDEKSEVRCVKCSNRSVCMKCWDERGGEVSRFYYDQTRPKTCFSCVQQQIDDDIELYCETVKSTSGQLNGKDAELIVREHDWTYKLADVRANSPDAVLTAYDLIRYPRLARFAKKTDESAFKDLSAAAVAIERSKSVMITTTMEKKVVASTYSHVGFKMLFGTTKKGAIDSNIVSANLESAEAFFRELKDGYSKIPANKCSNANPFHIAVWLCEEALFLLKVTKDDYLGRSFAALSEMSASDRLGLEQMARRTVYAVTREDRKSLKKGSLLTKSERLLCHAVYMGKVRKLELRSVQSVLVTGQQVESGSSLRQLEKRVASIQSKTDRLENSTRTSLTGDPNNPLAGNIKEWDYEKVSKLSQYIEMRTQIEQLSAQGQPKEGRVGWANSSVRTNAKMTMFVFDTYFGRYTPGCRNCWAEAGGEPPRHAYSTCRSLGNKCHLLCQWCNRFHDEWPDCCVSKPGASNSNDNNDGNDGGGGRGSRGGGNNNRGGGKGNNKRGSGGSQGNWGGHPVRKNNDRR
eukprot:g20316.t1